MLFKILALAALATAPAADGFVTPFAATTAFKGNALSTRVSALFSVRAYFFRGMDVWYSWAGLCALSCSSLGGAPREAQ